ncbi:MAG: hypothetical protein H7A22_06115 [Spirochaetales bacterium]|nr:hypothetical protein [Spirochaetales bacterium]
MTLQLITHRNQVRNLQRRFEAAVKSLCSTRFKAKLGSQGGNVRLPIHYSPEHKAYAGFMHADGRFWNAFGIGEASPNAALSIVTEINFPFEGVNRRVAGAFASEPSGAVHVLHSGKIGGGKAGIGKHLFQESFRGKWVTAKDEKSASEYALVGSLESPRFPLQLIEFVREVDRIKSLKPNGGQTRLGSKVGLFIPESTKRTPFRVSRSTEAGADHAIVVNALAGGAERLGWHVANNRQIDLLLTKPRSDARAILVEVKSDNDRQSIYTGVGQLMLHSSALRHRGRRLLVLPDGIDRNLRQTIGSLGIELVTYGWAKGNPRPKFREFPGLLNEK